MPVVESTPEPKKVRITSIIKVLPAAFNAGFQGALSWRAVLVFLVCGTIVFLLNKLTWYLITGIERESGPIVMFVLYSALTFPGYIKYKKIDMDKARLRVFVRLALYIAPFAVGTNVVAASLWAALRALNIQMTFWIDCVVIFLAVLGLIMPEHILAIRNGESRKVRPLLVCTLIVTAFIALGEYATEHWL